MSLDLEHTLSVGRALACTGDAARASAHLDRIRTLDVHRRFARETALLSVVVAVRLQRLGEAERWLAALRPLAAPEQVSMADMLASTPEASYPEYRRFVRRLMKGSGDAAAVARGWGVGIRLPWLLAGVAAMLAAAAVAVALLVSLPRQESAEASLERMLDQLQRGDFPSLWRSLPERYQAGGDLAFRAAMQRLPTAAFEDFRTIDRGLANLVFERRDRLSGSRVESIGPLFRTLSGEDDARALSRYFLMLSQSQLYDPQWLQAATVVQVLDLATSGDFRTCWQTYLRRWMLDLPIWTDLLGLKEFNRLGAFLATQRTFAIARPDDGSGRVIVAILTSGQPDRIDVPMQLVDGRWIPEALAREWEISTLQAKNDPARAAALLSRIFLLRPDFALRALDARKLLIIEAGRARSQEEFDERANQYFLGSN